MHELLIGIFFDDSPVTPKSEMHPNMLNRRHLRVKVLQSIYAFYQSGNKDIAAGEKELLFSAEKIYDLYLYQLMLLVALAEEEERIIEENLNKHLPSQGDLNPNRRFAENTCLKLLRDHPKLLKDARERRIGWQKNRDLVRKLANNLRQQQYYLNYLEDGESGLDHDSRFLVRVLKKTVMPFENLHAFYEEKSIYWLVDWELVNKMLIKTLKNVAETNDKLEIPELYKDPSDKVFAGELFRRTILNHEESDKVISAKTKNWDMERIALMDVIIMQMALTEILKFPEIPIKVSLNEYIELSKMYSTPKSKVFVNGVLDKLVEDLIREKKIPGHMIH